MFSSRPIIALACLLFIFILVVCGMGWARTWQYEYPVASGGVAGLYASIARESSGIVRVAYVGHGKLMYATRSGSWSTEVVNASGAASGEAPRWTSLALAGSIPHIAYYDARTGTLKHAWKSGVWQTETVDASTGVGKYCSLAVNPSGYPAIAYYDEANNALKYACQDASGWHISTIASGCGRYSSLAFDTSGNAHLAYYDSTEILKYGCRTGSSWTYATVDSAKFSGEMCSITVSSAGVPCIAYRDGFRGRLKYAWKNAGVWQVETADSKECCFLPSIAIGSDGYPRITYYRYVGWTDLSVWYSLETWYAYKTASGWTTQMIQRLASTNDQWCMSMVLDSNNRPCVAYHYFVSKSLNYMYFDGSGWVQEVADTGRQIGQYTSLALDSQDNPHISYQNMDDASLCYARKSGGSWVSEVADSESGCGSYSSLKILPSGYPAVAYSRFRFPFQDGEYLHSADLKYAYKDAGGWRPSKLLSDTGMYTSLFISGGNPKISYGSLRWRAEDTVIAEYSGGWSHTVVHYGSPPSGGTAWHADGLWTSLACDSAGNPRISYMETWENYDQVPLENGLRRRLMHAWRSGGVWYTEIVEDGQVGKFTSIAVNSSGYSCIAYQDVGNGYLKYAYKTASGWVKEIVDTDVATGAYASLALSPSGYPCIAYKSLGGQSLRYAWKDASGWRTETVDTSGRVGDYCSLALTSTGTPYIAYMDWDNLTLKVAYPSAETTGKISGYVKSSSGQPLADATVTISGLYSVQTNLDGSYLFTGISPGTYSLTASKTGYSPQTVPGVRVNAGETTTVNFSLSILPPGRIAGYVRDQGGAGISGASISASPGGYSTASQTNGSYALENIPAGTYSVMANKSGYASQTIPNVQVVSGQTTTVDFTLSTTYTRVADVKRVPDGQTVSLSGVVCSRRPSNTLMFVQDWDRAAGIKVTAGTGSIPSISPGTLCSITGLLQTVGDVREITNVQVTVGSSGSAPSPLSLCNCNVGGADFAYSAGPPVRGQKGSVWGKGVNNVGLLVSTWGRVLDTPSGGIFRISDGSISGGLPVKLASGVTAPPQGSYYVLTGIAEPNWLLLLSDSDKFDPTAPLLVNPGFEDTEWTPTGWTAYGNGMYVMTGAGYAGITPRSGSRYATNEASYTNPKNGGLYQQARARIGSQVTATAWTVCYGEGGGAANTYSRIGIDPTGATSPTGATVQWGSWYRAPSDGYWQWTQLSKSVTAASTTVTIFLEIRQDPNGPYAWPWQINAFDDVTVTCN